MEAKCQTAEVMAAQPSSPETLGQTQDQDQDQDQRDPDPMEDFSRQLEDIISTYGSAASLVEKQSVTVEPVEEKLEEEMSGDDVTVAKETGAGKGQKKLRKGLGKEASQLMQSLAKLRSPEEKLDAVLKKYAQLVEERGADQRQHGVVQQKLAQVQREREQLQSENGRAAQARSKLETLCRDLQKHNHTLKEETLQRCREEEEKRREITKHFQSTLTDIQAQIQQHSGRNTKLCAENANLADKLKSIINQYEQREESLEKIFKHRDLQQKLSDAKLEQAQAQLQEAEDKHKREKEYLLRETIDKTKKCLAMKQEELQMKKKLVLYSQKFDEFQTTLAKSNDVYASFKQEMEKMTKKMKKLDKESNIWKTRFESCNKALVEMIDERAAKEKEFEFFVVRIDKLEKLCRALQDERQGLYTKIKDIRHTTLGTELSAEAQEKERQKEKARAEVSEFVLEEVEVLTEEMSKLSAEQARLQAFAASLLAPPAGGDSDDDSDSEEEEEEEAVKAVPIPVQSQQVPLEPKPEPVQVSEELQKSPEPVPEPVPATHLLEAAPQLTASIPTQATGPVPKPVPSPLEKAPVAEPAEKIHVPEPAEKIHVPEPAETPAPEEDVPVAAPVNTAPVPAEVHRAPAAAALQVEQVSKPEPVPAVKEAEKAAPSKTAAAKPNPPRLQQPTRAGGSSSKKQTPKKKSSKKPS